MDDKFVKDYITDLLRNIRTQVRQSYSIIGALICIIGALICIIGALICIIGALIGIIGALICIIGTLILHHRPAPQHPHTGQLL